MSSKSKLSRLACKDIKLVRKDTASTKETETVLPEVKVNNLNTTPIARKSLNKDDMEDEHLSPLFMRFTQDSGDDDLDVVWDWDSPRSKGNRNILRKRILHSSPKLPKKHVLNDKTLPRFNSLKAELEQLANNLQDQDTHDHHVFNTDDIFVKPKPPVSSSDNKDLFDDDSFDAEMIKCSQKVEETYNLNQWCSSIMNNNKEFKSSENKSHLIDTTIKDDSFDVLLEEIKDEDIEKLSQASSSSNSSQPTILTKSVLTVSSPRSISRTNSVPTSFFTKPISTISSSILVSRTKSDETGKSELIQCSPEEIEKKRQEARAKLEFKKKQQEIEKKRLEAMERLKRNRMQKIHKR